MKRETPYPKGYCLIPLTQGYSAKVSPADYDRVIQYAWRVSIRKDGRRYAQRYVPKGEAGSTYLHRFIMDATDPSTLVDHQNGDGLDCTRANIEPSSHKLNARNIVAARPGSTSRHLGVHFNSSRQAWEARLKSEGVVAFLGGFPTEAEANLARLTYEKTVWGVQPRRLKAFQEAGLA